MMKTRGQNWTFSIQTVVGPTPKNKKPTLDDALGIHVVGLRCLNKHRPGHLYAPTYNGYFDLKLNRESFLSTTPRHIYNRYAFQFSKNDGFTRQEISHVVLFNVKRHISLVCGILNVVPMDVGDTITFDRGKINLYIPK